MFELTADQRTTAMKLLVALLTEAMTRDHSDDEAATGRWAMTKITPEHLARSAIVYVRQSTAYQVTNNLESQRRQYGLVDRGRQLGWSDVQVIDDDLGRSGSGAARPGFEKLLAAICEGRVGAVLSIEASRLARNGRDWHPLLEFCGLVGTLIVDEDGIYDSRSPNDRLLLGMKGTMSEMELSVFRQRSREAMQQKARRGELFLTVAIGYVKADDDRIEKDPDRRVQDAIGLVFAKFAELQTVRQVLVWFRQENVLLPAFVQGTGKRPVEWKVPVYHTLHHMLTNPVYAGAYAFGRRGMRVTIEDGRKRVVRSLNRDPKDWDVLIKDHHKGYISWGQFERNQRLIADNANGKSYMGRGSIRRGEALLQACSAVADAARSSRSPTAARAGQRSAMSAAARSRPWQRTAALPSGACELTAPLRRRCSIASSRSALKPLWPHLRRKMRSNPRRDVSLRMPSRRRATRPHVHTGSTMP
jgi:DNA invertase Pin-like site-specific DNA recombinase